MYKFGIRREFNWVSGKKTHFISMIELEIQLGIEQDGDCEGFMS